ncbi:MAG: transcription factor TFIIH complex subunit Ssl1 [Amphiamblys sp. WSBS2006]|nr:MAG: transcription factor TFIIH complex subunit Ssl1 [Amphiamblys sp. WSBS2006]
MVADSFAGRLCLVLDTSRETSRLCKIEEEDRHLPKAELLLEVFYWITETYQETKIRHLSVFTAHDEVVEMKTDFVASWDCRKIIKEEDLKQSGEVSLFSTLKTVSEYLAGYKEAKEVLLLLGSQQSKDSDDINKIIPFLVEKEIRVSAYVIGSEIEVVRRITEETGGWMVCTGNSVRRKALVSGVVSVGREESKHVTVEVGIPSRKKTGVCVCHGKEDGVYVCPRCSTSVCKAPTDCPVCELYLSPYFFVQKTSPKKGEKAGKGECSGCLDFEECFLFDGKMFCNTCCVFLGEFL